MNIFMSNSFFGKSLGPVNLGQAIYPVPPVPSPAPEPTDTFTVPPKPEKPYERPETTETMPPEAVKELKDLAPGADQALNDLCFFLNLYGREVMSQVKNFKEMKDAADAVTRVLDRNKAIEGNLWEFIFQYCDAPSVAVKEFANRRLPNVVWAKPQVPVATPGRTPVKTPTIQPRPVVLPPPAMGPVPLQDVATPGSIKTPTAQPPAPIPRYTDVATGGGVSYSPDLQKQLDSYSEKLHEYYNRPSGTRVPGTERPAVATTQCPPGQFWDGRQCRGSIAPGAAGLISAAAGMGPGGATMDPGAFGGTGGMPTTSYQIGVRYPVVNL